MDKTGMLGPPETLDHGTEHDERQGLRKRHVTDADEKEHEADRNCPFRSGQDSLETRSYDGQQQIRREQQAMAGAPWKNAANQAEYSGGTNQEYKWPHTSWDSRHFSPRSCSAWVSAAISPV